MPNGIYALANPANEGATLSINEEFNILSDEQVNTNTTAIDYFEAFLDEPVYSGYEENKTKIAIGWGVAALAVVAGLAIAATVVTGGAAAGVAVVATAALVGTISAGANIASQVAANQLNGNEQKIDWAAVAIAGFSGAISGAVAASPLGVGGQVIVNAALGGTVAYTQGGSVSDIMLNTGLGTVAGKLGGAGPKWSGNTNIFVPREVGSCGIINCYGVSSRATMTFKNLWRGLNANQYIGDVFTGISGGFYKGLATSNVLGTLGGYCLEGDKVENATNYVKKLWNKYKPDFLKEDESEDNQK